MSPMWAAGGQTLGLPRNAFPQPNSRALDWKQSRWDMDQHSVVPSHALSQCQPEKMIVVKTFLSWKNGITGVTESVTFSPEINPCDGFESLPFISHLIFHRDRKTEETGF